MVCDAFVDVADGGLGGVGIWVVSIRQCIEKIAVETHTNGRHVAEHLGAVDADPVERRMREDISAYHNIRTNISLYPYL